YMQFKGGDTPRRLSPDGRKSDSRHVDPRKARVLRTARLNTPVRNITAVTEGVTAIHYGVRLVGRRWNDPSPRRIEPHTWCARRSPTDANGASDEMKTAAGAPLMVIPTTRKSRSRRSAFNGHSHSPANESSPTALRPPPPAVAARPIPMRPPDRKYVTLTAKVWRSVLPNNALCNTSLYNIGAFCCVLCSQFAPLPHLDLFFRQPQGFLHPADRSP